MRLILLTAVLLIVPVYAISINYEISPEIVLPNGYADCTIRISNTGIKEEEIRSISFISNAVEVYPFSVYIGKIAPESVYTLKVSMKSQIVGRHVVEMYVSSDNYSIMIPLELIVDDNFPQIAISSPLYKGEVNNARVIISSPVALRDLRVEALFNATPKVYYLGTLSAISEMNFKFNEEIEELHFKISFYNGKSYHEIIRSLKVNYLESKGLLTSLKLSRDVLFSGEAVNLTLDIANLRNDEIYLLEVKAFGKGKFARSYEKIEKLGVGEKKSLNFIFSPNESGKVELRISYRDYFGKEYELVESASILVLETKALQIVNMQIERVIGKTRIYGEIVNYGHRSALSIGISAFCDENRADYFIGKVEANDYETFDLEIACRNVTLELSWWNEAGERFFTVEKLKTEDFRPEQSGSATPLIVAIVSAIVIALLLVYIVLRHRK